MFEVGAFRMLVWALWAGAGLWLSVALITLRRLARQKQLKAASHQESLRADAPFVSIIVPARNEEGRVLAASIRSMLAQDYLPFEIVVVNDCSTDATGTILKTLAQTDERLRVIDGTPTPAGWLGKPHALQQALDCARGDWILATDADIIFHQAALRTALCQASAEGSDALTLLPKIESTVFWERALMPAFGWFVLIAFPFERVNDPVRDEAIGVGGFFLISRAKLRRVGEYEAVRAEVVEDIRMAELLKQAGARLRIEYAPDLISTAGYSSFLEIWQGFSKNIFAGLKFSLWQTAAGALATLIFIIAPFCIMLVSAMALAKGAPFNWSRLLLPALIIWLIQVATFGAINRAFGVPARYALTVPLGHALVVAILINSAFSIVTGRGVTWKGRKVYERAGGMEPPRARVDRRRT